MDDDDFFDDDDLDDIPDKTLQQLEEHAWTSTQQLSGVSTSAALHSHSGVATRATLSHADSARKKLPWRPPLPQVRQKNNQALTDSHAIVPAGPSDVSASDDYGLGDEDVIDLDGPGKLSETTFLPNLLDTHLEAKHRPTLQQREEADSEAAFAAADLELADEGRTHALYIQKQSHNSGGESALHARIAELEEERMQLRLSEQRAREVASAKQGEVAIVRANQDKVVREYEQRITVMQRLHADDVAKQKLELETNRKEKEKMETANRFLQHDLVQESERVKKVNTASTTKPMTVRTPRKPAKRLDIGDGFENAEVQFGSPSKNKDRSREQTPKLGAKRKRQAQDSPVEALSFTHPNQFFQHGANELVALLDHRHENAVVTLESDQYSFMQRILLHVPQAGHDRTIEALSRYIFPSNVGKTLSSMLIEQLMLSEHPVAAVSLPIKLGNIALGLWSRCLQDKYYRPLYLLLSLIRYAVWLEPSSAVSQLTEYAVPLCLKSIDLVVVPQFQAMGAVAKPSEDFETLKRDIDVSKILSLLQHICESASLAPERVHAFWKHWHPQQALLGLSRVRSMGDIVTSLRMLALSTRSTSWGPIAAKPEGQYKQEMDLLDRVTLLLFEVPQPPSGEPPYDAIQIANLRLEVLALFKSICMTDHGCGIFAEQHNALGRLVLFLNYQVNALYNVPPPSPDRTSVYGPAGPAPQIHDLVVESVNTTVKLIHYVLTRHETVDIVQKVQAIRGGYHKFLVSMTRIAFSEQLVFEQGIEDEVVETAHSLLDDVLSPDEGEAVVKAVETPRGTKNTHSARAASAEAMIMNPNENGTIIDTAMSFHC
nr:hypothetical protein CFP56_63340 [Quercus suber]